MPEQRCRLVVDPCSRFCLEGRFDVVVRAERPPAGRRRSPVHVADELPLSLRRCRLHDLRHAYATRLVKAKTNARVVSDVMGHATVAFTLQTYYSPGDEEMADVAATIETAMGDTCR